MTELTASRKVQDTLIKSARYEIVLIGMMVSRPRVIDYVASAIDSRHFLDQAISRLFTRLCDMRSAGSTVNQSSASVAFAALFARDGLKMGREFSSESIQDMKEAFDLWYVSNFESGKNNDPTYCWQYAIEAVIEGYRIRQLLKLSDDVRNQLHAGIYSTGEVIEKAEAKLKAVSIVDTNQDTLTLSQAMTSVINDAVRHKDSNEVVKFVKWGTAALDQVCGPIVGSTLTIVAARPGVGKTILGVQIAMHNTHLKKSLLFCSLEMSHDQIAHRVIAAKTSISSADLQLNRLDKQDIVQIGELADSWGPLPFSVYAPTESVTVESIAAKARYMATEPNGLTAIVIDYLSLIRLPSGKQELRDKLGDAAKKLRNLAKELGVPVVLLCQLNRQATTGLPTAAQIADSDQIQRHADTIVLIHDQQRDDDFCLIVAKNRAGKVGLIDASREAKNCRFVTAGDNRFNEFD